MDGKEKWSQLTTELTSYENNKRRGRPMTRSRVEFSQELWTSLGKLEFE